MKRLREQAGLSQEELAERAGLTAKGISALERGERKHPYPNTVRALAEALALSETVRGEWVAMLSPRGTAYEPSPKEPLPLRFPTAPNAIVGREDDLASVIYYLTSGKTRLVTLTGPGGVGKTRLSLQLAEFAQTQFADGAVFVPLDAVPNPALFLSALVHALGLQEVSEQAKAQWLYQHLKDKKMVLILDNFEHVLDAACEIPPLLRACPGLTLLVTSRAPLRLRGEQEYPLAPLAVPGLDRVPHVNEVLASPAVQVFVQRAQAINPGFSITSANAVTIAAICRRLDGLPLALELAAARLKLLTPATLLKRLDQTLPVLVGGARDLPERQQTMRQTIAWSYDLLTPGEQRLFRRLSVFAGSWTLEAAEALCQNLSVTEDILERVASLMDKSLIQRADREGESERYILLKTIRAYALEQLVLAGEADAVQARHLQICLELAREAEKQVCGPDQMIWLKYLEEELPNLRAALEWAFSVPQAAETCVEDGLQIVCALYRFWQGRGYLSEGRAWLERGLSFPVSLAVRAKALNGLGWLMHQLGDARPAIGIQQESIDMYRQLQDATGLSGALDSLGDAAWAFGDYELAAKAYEESLALRRTAGHTHEIALSLYSLGRLLLDRETPELAAPLLDESYALLTKLQDHRGIALVDHALGRLAWQQGRLPQALTYTQKALAAFWSLGNKVDIAECLEVLALIAKDQAQWPQAVECWAVAAALRETLGVPVRAYDEKAFSSLQDLLHEPEFQAAWNVGYNQPLAQALAEIIPS